MKVFVYGTLRKTSWNEGWMETAGGKFLCYAKTKDPKIMIAEGIPYLYDFNEMPDGTSTNFQSIGEIYEVNNIAPLDRLESNGRHYERKIDKFIKLTKVEGDDEYEETSEEIESWVYYSVNQNVPTKVDFIEDFFVQ